MNNTLQPHNNDIKNIIEVNILDNTMVIDASKYNDDDYIIDTEATINSSLFSTEIAEYIAGKGGKQAAVYIVEQEDTSDIQSALEKIPVKIFSQGDMIIITSSDRESTTGYIYTKEYEWIAFSGNSSVSTTLFEDDILCAGNYTQVGNITKSATGTTVIPAKGKTVEEVMTSIFTQELQPTKTEPSVSLTFSQAGAKEVGTLVTPSYSATLSAGAYSYGPATGVSASAWEITDSNGNNSTSSSGSLPSFSVLDSTRYTITAKATHNEGTIALTNIGNQSNPPVQIAAGTKSKTSSAVTGYRSFFYGVLNNLNQLNSAAVRAMTNGKAASAQKITIKVNGNTSAKRICVALPTSSGLKIKLVMKTDGLATDITSAYSKTETVMVDGANNINNLVSYDIWTYQPASIDASEVHEITIG